MARAGKNHNTSKDYELLVRGLIEQKLSGVSGVDLIEILHNAKIKGLSGYEHQIDVAYRFRIWKTEILVLVECKQYQKRVGVDELLEFKSRLDDVRAHKGIFITSSSFQRGAREFAKANRIALMVVRGTRHWAVDYCLMPMSDTERCVKQMAQLHRLYLDGDDTKQSMITIDKTQAAVLVENAGVQVKVVPGEMQLSMLYLEDCDFESRETNSVYLAGDRFKHLKLNRIAKEALIELVLSPAVIGGNPPSDGYSGQ
jgi:hypothetical protein